MVDEEDRWAWAVNFYQALLKGDLPATLVGDGYPGIFPVWLETLWLLTASIYRSVLQGGWIDEAGVNLLLHEWGRWSNLELQRFPVVLANTLLVVGIFWYTRHLFGRRVGLLAAVLISLDPFYLSDSRVNRAEALLTGLMSLSMLALLTWLRWQRQRHFVASAIFGGLAWLTKSQALVLLPMFGAITLVWFLRRESTWQAGLRRAVMVMLGWTALAAVTFVALWPATWTVPGPTFSLMERYITRKVGEEGVKLFYLGRTILDEDPGLTFYPVIFILRVTPLTLAGLLIGLGLALRHRPQRWLNWRGWLDEEGVWLVAAFGLLYVGGMSLGSHKQDRFLMTIFPAINILAALAYVRLTEGLAWSPRRVQVAGAGLLALQLATALPFHPYYFTYFNPLIGGGPTAVRLTRIGWGEGMEQVAAYLNTLEDPESLTVATRFSKYLLGYRGEVLDLDSDGEWAQADKVIFYIQQAQRMLDPSPGVIRYFQQHVPPEQVFTINRIDYAWVYPNPIEYPALAEVDHLPGQMALFGYRWEETAAGANSHLVWENLGTDAQPALRLWAGETRQTDWQPCHPAPGFEEVAQTPGEVMESICHLSGAGLAPGLYSLEMGLPDESGAWQTLSFAAGQAAIERTDAGSLVRVSPEVAFARLADEALPATAHRLEHTYDFQARLLAHELSAEALHPGETLTVSLYWQALQPIEAEYQVSLQAFIGPERIALLNDEPLAGERPTDSWQPGEVIRDDWAIPIPAEIVAPSLVRIDVGLFEPKTVLPLQVRNLAGVDIPGAIATVRLVPAAWPRYQGDSPLAIRYGEAAHLIGYTQTTAPDGNLDLTLYWQAQGAFEADYTAFVHLVDGAGALISQSDVPPAAGHYPTSVWGPGEVILSHHHLILPPDLPTGTYAILSGLYHPIDWTRLPATGPDGQTYPNHAPSIGEVVIP